MHTPFTSLDSHTAGPSQVCVILVYLTSYLYRTGLHVVRICKCVSQIFKQIFICVPFLPGPGPTGLITTINMPQDMCDCPNHIKTNENPHRETQTFQICTIYMMWHEAVLWRYATKALGRGDHMANMHIYSLFYWRKCGKILWIMFLMSYHRLFFILSRGTGIPRVTNAGDQVHPYGAQ